MPPGTTRRMLRTELLRSSHSPFICCDGPWQLTQFCRNIGNTSCSKSILAGTWAGKPSISAHSARIVHTTYCLDIGSSERDRLTGESRVFFGFAHARSVIEAFRRDFISPG